MAQKENSARRAGKSGTSAGGASEGLPDLDNVEMPLPTGKSTLDDTRLSFLMHDVSRLRRRAFDAVMGQLGVTRAQWWVIAHLSRQDGMMQIQLATMLDIGKASLGNLVERLETGGWIERRFDSGDRRAKRVFLTRKSRQLIEEMHNVEFAFNEQSMAGITREQRDAMLQFMAKFKSNLLEMCNQAESKI